MAAGDLFFRKIADSDRLLVVAAGQFLFVSSNAWDAHAAAAFGMRAVWCNRQRQAPDRLPGQPFRQISTLDELPGLLAQ